MGFSSKIMQKRAKQRSRENNDCIPYLALVFLVAELELDVGVREAVVVHGDEVTTFHQHHGNHVRPHLHFELARQRFLLGESQCALKVLQHTNVE